VVDFSKLEEKILKFWQENKIFEKSLKGREGSPRFVFYEGPPFANAQPGVHHVLARAFKDAVLRYKTMRGYYVPRKGGWDTHGLPVEMEVEKKLGIKSKPDIEKMGVEKFTKACAQNIFTYKKLWEEMTERMGYWLDLKNAYITCSNEYIESVWWILKQLWDKGLIYQTFKVVPYCPRCGTSLSDHEVAQGYKETEDPSVFVKFEIRNSKFENVNFLVWTTTPWTLPANVALAVNPEFKYVKAKVGDEILILAKEQLSVLDKNYKILKEFKGKELVGLRYEPLFEVSNAPYHVVGADFVSLDEGTGIVHIAPAFGVEDMELAKKENLPVILNVNGEGKFKQEVRNWAGKFVKEADPEIIKDLEKRGFLYKKGTVAHSYPFCWRCDTPLLYYAKNSWYIKTTTVKSKMLDNNKKINWIPHYIKDGRFGNWLKENVDWTISRERYWGTPLPIWKCEKCNHAICVGSIKELENLIKSKEQRAKIKELLRDLHRPYIDGITFLCQKCGGEMRRVPEVLDCWFDSGSMPFASHFAETPRDRRGNIKKIVKSTIPFPADFIAEGIDQTRGWFYTLLAISTLLDLGPAYKNVISLGLVLDEKGQKMSKSKGNVILPMEILGKYGADAVRLYFYLSPLGETLRFSEKDLAEVFRKFIITLYNSFIFYQTYADSSSLQPAITPSILDKWILSKLNQVIAEMSDAMEKYNITKSARLLYDFVLDDISNWYIRRSRKRQTSNFFQTLGRVLLGTCRLAAPFVPFISEEIYQQLSDTNKRLAASIHLEDWPEVETKLIDKELNKNMDLVRKICELGLAARAEAKIKVRQPLSELRIKSYELKDKELLDLIKDELNVKEVKELESEGVKELGENWVTKEDDGIKIALNVQITPYLKQEGMAREIVRHIQEIRKRKGFKPTDYIIIFWQTDDRELLDVMKKFGEKIGRETRSELRQGIKIKDEGEEVVVEGKRLMIEVGKRD
jgi:isoleucyl-tRNA synthetase